MPGLRQNRRSDALRPRHDAGRRPLEGNRRFLPVVSLVTLRQMRGKNAPRIMRDRNPGTGVSPFPLIVAAEFGANHISLALANPCRSTRSVPDGCAKPGDDDGV